MILLIATAIVVSSMKYKPTQDDKAGLSNLQALPLQIGKWKGKDFPLEEKVYDILETRAIIHRSYNLENQGDSFIFLSIVHYHDTKVEFHAPEACLGSKGIKTQTITKTIALLSGNHQQTIDVAQIITKRANDQTLTYYFYKAGNFMGNNYIKMRLAIAGNKFTSNDTKGSLIRLSITLPLGSETKAEKLLIDFMEDLLIHIHQTL